MAAVLKKRVVAEFTQTLQEEVKHPPVKKLRLAYRPQHAELRFDLSGCQTARETFQVLLDLEERLPLSPEHIQPTVSVLTDRLRTEKEPAVRAKIAGILAQIGRSPACNSLCLAEDLKNILASEKSSVVVSAIIGALSSIGQTHGSNSKLKKSLFDLACKNLSNASHLVRIRCLRLIGELSGPDSGDSQSGSPIVSALGVLGSFSQDSDGRVRAQAFQSMLLWHQRGIRIEQSVYTQACRALTDDDEGVRLAAVKLIWVLGQLYPNSMIVKRETIRLVDDVFANICNMVNDLSVGVRAEAAGLLGSLHSVSPVFLQQTLDKKLMSNMRYKRTAHERQKEHFESGEWSTGQKWADDAPKDDVDPEAVSLISSGACGAFVHGLEDEYLEVRNAAIDSLCELASNSPSFAKSCQDFLVDMFNDEIEGVRLNAINSLCKICHHFLLREDQLDIILSVLKDFNTEIREALRDMLSHCRLATKACLKVLIFELLENYKRYPEDRLSIWKCMKDLGRHHSSLVLSMVTDLLCVHPYFEPIEPDVDDPSYVSILVLVFNAAADSSTMSALFPSYINTHYTYLRDSLPDLVPALQMSESNALSTLKSRINSQSATITGITTTFLQQTLSRLEGVRLLDHRSAIQLMRIAIRDLKQVEQIEPDSSASAECVALYLQCQLHLEKALHNSSNNSIGYSSHQQLSRQTAFVHKVLRLITHMEHQFVGLGVAELVQIRQLCICAKSLQLLGLLEDSGGAAATTSATAEAEKTAAVVDKQLACKQYLHCLSSIQDLLVKSGSPAGLCTLSLLAEISSLKCGDPSLYQRVLLSSLAKYSPSVLRLSNQLQKAQAVICEPSGSTEVALKFTAGLFVAVPLIANLNNIRDLSRIRIRVTYPDEQVHLIVPSMVDFKQRSELQHKLITKVRLSHSIWSEPGCVSISVVLLCSDKDKNITGLHTIDTGATMDKVIDIGQSVSVIISPMPTRKL